MEALTPIIFSMRKLITFILLILCIEKTYAVTVGRFIPGGRQVTVTITNKTQVSSDNDGGILYSALNLPVENTFLGPGKSLVTTERDLNFNCVVRDGNNPTCSIILNASTKNVKIDAFQNYARYQATGPLAQELATKFHLQDGSFSFTNQEGNLKISVSDSVFKIEFQNQ
jgi:hypothetical protein